jgi:signal transduction histidine kinase
MTVSAQRTPRSGGRSRITRADEREELRRTQQELARLEDRVRELEDERAVLARMAADAAHELSEPLVTIEGYAILLQKELGDRAGERACAQLDALVRTGAKMRLLVETLLNEARAPGPLAAERVDLGALVEDAVAVLLPEITAHGTRVIVATPLPELTGNRLLLGTVVKNLIANALRYGPRARGTIRITATQKNDNWLIAVAGTGTPIPAAERERIFEPFERARAERRCAGTGLGLAICRRIVERHGGRIGVQSWSRGNRFSFTIPA